MTKQQQATIEDANPKLTRSELATKRAQARMWATLEFARIINDLRKREPDSIEARLVYRAELVAYLRLVDESLVQP